MMTSGDAIAYPRMHELKVLMRELRTSLPKATFVHGDLLWRARRGESMEIARLLGIYTYNTEPELARSLRELRECSALREPLL